MASTTFRLLFTSCRQFPCRLVQTHSLAGGIASCLSFSTKSKPPTKMSLPKVFFDMSADNEHLGRIIIEVNIICFTRPRLIFFFCSTAIHFWYPVTMFLIIYYCYSNPSFTDFMFFNLIIGFELLKTVSDFCPCAKTCSAGFRLRKLNSKFRSPQKLITRCRFT